MKRILFLMTIVALLCSTASCKKNCRCYGYDGSVTNYSKDEVEDNGNSCSGMIYMYGTRYYSLCEWDD